MPLIDPIAILADRFRSAIAVAFPDVGPDVDPLISAAKQTQFGDFQSNVAMSLAKRVGKPPREVAKAIVAHADISDVAEKLGEASIAGPGFINIRLKGDALARLLTGMDTPALGIEPAQPPQTIVVDLFGVNLAKQMHVGHLRSPFIGDALARVFERQGHKVIRQNHVGDWGLPIAMVTARLLRLSEQGKIDLSQLTLEDLDANYKAAQAECLRDMEGLNACKRYGLGPKALAECEEQVNGATEVFTRAREVLLKLQAKEPKTFAVWQRIADITMGVCLSVAKRLNVNCTEEHSAGESSYANELAPMVAELESRGIAVVDQGALIVRLDAPPTIDGKPAWEPMKEPCLIRKTDGGYLYATTDVCAVRRRVQTFHADRVVYAIDARQSLHLRQVFAASYLAGYSINPITKKPAILQHAAFGSVLGEDGRPFKTRSGESVNLQALIDEAVQRAAREVRARSPELPEADVQAAAEIIGVAAMKYADLRTDRVKDYMFSFDRMLAFEGDTGAYLQYAYARIKNIFRRASERGKGAGWEKEPIAVLEPAEKTLALALLRYPSALASTADAIEPHRLCNYIYDLAVAFSGFYDQCPVVTAPTDQSVRQRLRLCDLTRRVLEDALHTLGIPTVDRM
jgi:arginyl-tRNA synthetase